jgi:hypothetical protein
VRGYEWSAMFYSKSALIKSGMWTVFSLGVVVRLFSPFGSFTSTSLFLSIIGV